MNLIQRAAKPLFHKEIRPKRMHHLSFKRKTIIKESEWFDASCLEKKRSYLEALHIYNGDKSDEKRIIFMQKKKEYKQYIKNGKIEYKRTKMVDIEKLRTQKPRQFWKFFSKKNKSKGSNISVNEFYTYFKNLSDEINTTVDQDSERFCEEELSINDPIFEELDMPITLNEVQAAIKSLNCDKACGSDEMINEYFIESADILSAHITDLFNVILSHGHFPSAWMEGLIIPVFKKGDDTNVQNYRGITLCSVV